MKRIKIEWILLGIILLIGFLIRLRGISYDLPYIYNPDEPNYIRIVQTIFRTGDLNPHFFNYPSLFFYLNVLAYVPYYLVGKAIGVLHSRSDILFPTTLTMGVTWAPMPSTVLLGRSITLFFGLSTIGLAYWVGRKVSGKSSIGLLAASFIAVASGNVWNSDLITPDTFVTFFALTAMAAAILVFQQGKTWQYVVAGLCVGLTASSKYNGCLIILPLLLAHFFRFGLAGIKQPKLYLALLFCGIGFLGATPYALLDTSKFIADVRFEGIHYSTGHPGMEGNSLVWYLNFMWLTMGIVPVFAALEILRGFFSRSKEILLLSTFPIVYFIFISSFIVRNDRTFLPLTPFLFILAASFLVYLQEVTSKLKRIELKWTGYAAITVVCLFSLCMIAFRTIPAINQWTEVNSRETARVWIDQNLPEGSKIAIESYAPFVDPARFSVQGYGQIIEHDAGWYRNQGYDYLVFSQGMYGRYFLEPAKYASQKSQYDQLFTQLQLVKIFMDGGYEVRVYKISQG